MPVCGRCSSRSSVAKATLAAQVFDGSVPVHTVTPNVDELGALLGSAVADTDEGILAAADRLHRRGVQHVWVRRGARGSLALGRPGRPPPPLARWANQPPDRSRRGTRRRGRRRHRRG